MRKGSCRKCQKAQYVGQSQNSLRERFYLHLSHIGINVGTPLAMHLDQHDYMVEDKEGMVIERVYGSSLAERLRRERE